MEFLINELSRRLRCPDSEIERFIKSHSYPIGADIIIQKFEIDDGHGVIGFYFSALDDQPSSVHLKDYKRFEVTYLKWAKHQKKYTGHVWKSFLLLFNLK